MITSIADKVVRGYIKEACAVLGMDEVNIRLLYVPKVNSRMGIPQFSVITPDGCLVLDESRVNQAIMNEKPTVVRHEVYCKNRMLFQQ